MNKFKEEIDIMRTYWSPDDEVQNDLTNLLVLCSDVEQNAYERGYGDGYDKGNSDGRFFGVKNFIDFINENGTNQEIACDDDLRDFLQEQFDYYKEQMNG